MAVQTAGKEDFEALLMDSFLENEPLEGASVVDNISWRTGLQYEMGKDSMAFLTVSKGYKGPQVVFNPPGLIPSVGLGAIRLLAGLR